jgi:hypothetical protein
MLEINRDELVKFKGNIDISEKVKVDIEKFDLEKILDYLLDLYLKEEANYV